MAKKIRSKIHEHEEVRSPLREEPWDPRYLADFRKRHGLSKSELHRLLREHPGLERVTWDSLFRWETGNVTPNHASRVFLRAALTALDKRASSAA